MKMREEILKEFKHLRTEQIKVLNKFCKENGICDRCHNPNRPVVDTGTKCQVCLDYLKKYAKDRRNV